MLRAAERRRTIRPGGHRPVWVTEFWWNTNPPNTARGMSPGRQARAVEQSLYLFWKAGVSVAINLEIRDAPFIASNPLATNQSGLYYVDGTPKPSLTAFRFPLVADRRRGARKGVVWGRSPATGGLQIELLARGRWRPAATFHVLAGQVFTRRLKLKHGARLRASVAGEQSLVWAQR